MPFPLYTQHDAMDCGPTCLRMIAKHYGKEISIARLRQASGISREGVSLLGISQAAEQIGFKTVASRISFEQLDEDALLPCVLHWRQNHFVVLPPQNYRSGGRKSKILIADPAQGLIKLDREAFLDSWLANGRQGLVLELQPTPAFYNQEAQTARTSWHTLLFYLNQHRKYFFQVATGLLVGSLLQLVFPFLTQSMVDTGIHTHNLSFIYLVLAAQAMLFFARTLIEFIRSRLLLFISTRINISLLTGFWQKLMKLPLAYFDTKLSGDIQQRIQDQHQIERFLTGSSLSLLFSVVNLLVFSIVLLIYSLQIAFIFVIGSLLYFAWVRHFLSRRQSLNYQRFAISVKEHAATLQLIQGMQEIRLNNAERFFRWDWEHIQARLFKLNFASLSLSQVQQSGAIFINEGKNLLITFLAAKLVLDGQLSLGAMLAVQYIIGQLNSPVEQLVGFSQSAQDARIALERLHEIEGLPDEEPALAESGPNFPADRSISICGLRFSYSGAAAVPVLRDINLIIPEGKVTAIVGMSGSGKTTLLKLLLKVYENYTGDILIGEPGLKGLQRFPGNDNPRQGEFPRNGNGHEACRGMPLRSFSPSLWRGRCASVMQDGYMFNDTIERNIAVGEEHADPARLLAACRMANIQSFVDALPLGFGTKIGAEGNGISQGQKQRILIARAVYRDPDYIFFDEATNAMDASNERIIMGNLGRFFSGRTVVIVAHRLSTVKGADNIVVLHEGAIVETGTHAQLAAQKGYYYELVRNQLELDA